MLLTYYDKRLVDKLPCVNVFVRFVVVEVFFLIVCTIRDKIRINSSMG